MSLVPLNPQSSTHWTMQTETSHIRVHFPKQTSFLFAAQHLHLVHFSLCFRFALKAKCTSLSTWTCRDAGWTRSPTPLTSRPWANDVSHSHWQTGTGLIKKKKKKAPGFLFATPTPLAHLPSLQPSSSSGLFYTLAAWKTFIPVRTTGQTLESAVTTATKGCQRLRSESKPDPFDPRVGVTTTARPEASRSWLHSCGSTCR